MPYNNMADALPHTGDQRERMLRALLPKHVAAVVTLYPRLPGSLLSAEARQIRGVVASRLTEFATGRYCARQALQQLGIPPTAILIGPNREPVWPAGIVGSITHCSGFYAAAACLQSMFATLGIDAELHESLPVGLVEQILVDEERRWLNQAPRGTCWDRLIFSAKESAYKAWFQLTKEWLGFDEATIIIDCKKQTFLVEIHAEALQRSQEAVKRFRGRYRVEDALILTAVIA